MSAGIKCCRTVCKGSRKENCPLGLYQFGSPTSPGWRWRKGAVVCALSLTRPKKHRRKPPKKRIPRVSSPQRDVEQFRSTVTRCSFTKLTLWKDCEWTNCGIDSQMGNEYIIDYSAPPSSRPPDNHSNSRSLLTGFRSALKRADTRPGQDQLWTKCRTTCHISRFHVLHWVLLQWSYWSCTSREKKDKKKDKAGWSYRIKLQIHPHKSWWRWRDI